MSLLQQLVKIVNSNSEESESVSFLHVTSHPYVLYSRWTHFNSTVLRPIYAYIMLQTLYTMRLTSLVWVTSINDRAVALHEEQN